MRFSRTMSLALLLLASSVADAGSPRVTRMTTGGQRGTTLEIEFIGKHLDQPREVMLYEPGITVDSVKMAETMLNANGKAVAIESGTRVVATLKIAPDCPLGAHGLRLRTSTGLADYRSFFVGAFPVIEEEEVITKARNDKREAAKAVPANTTVLGRINDAADVDTYKIDVKKGQRVSAEIEAARLGVDRGIPDLFLTILDPDGKKIAETDDSALFVQDPVLSVLADRDGSYYVSVRQSMFNGANETYRLHVGTFSRPTGIYPSGGQAGTEVKVKILGDPKGEWTQTVRLPSAPGEFPFVAVDAADKVPSASPNRMRISPFPNVLEQEPNDTVETASTALTTNLPVAFNGIINKPGDVDGFRFRAKKGESFRFHALGQGLGSPIDTTIWIRSTTGKGGILARAGDSRSTQYGFAPAQGQDRILHDAILEFTAPADGEYVMGVEDGQGQGGADYVYRVEARQDENAVYTYIAPEPENRFQPQLRQTVAVPVGNKTTVQVGIVSTSKPISGELEIVGLNLPKGVTIQAPRITPSTTKVPVVFEASAEAQVSGALIDLVVRPVSGSAIPSGYRQTIMLNEYGNADYYHHIYIDKLALAVTEKAGFQVRVEEPKSALVQNGEMTLKIKVDRDPGFKEPVTVQLEWKPNGISTTTPVTIHENETEGRYLLGASRGASAGSYNVTLTGMSGQALQGYQDGGNRSYVATTPFKLTIAEPHVEAKIARTSIERGKTANLVCKLSQLQAFEGNAQVTLSRLPRGVELVEPTKQITSADKEVTFTLKATSEALLGNYTGIVMDLTVIEKGQAVRQLSGNGQLRIDAERRAAGSQ